VGEDYQLYLQRVRAVSELLPEERGEVATGPPIERSGRGLTMANGEAPPTTARTYISGVLAFVVSVGFMAMLAVLLFQEIPPNNKEIFFTGFGIMGSLFVAIVQYYFGSSLGSLRKTEASNAAAIASVKATP